MNLLDEIQSELEDGILTEEESYWELLSNFDKLTEEERLLISTVFDMETLQDWTYGIQNGYTLCSSGKPLVLRPAAANALHDWLK